MSFFMIVACASLIAIIAPRWIRSAAVQILGSASCRTSRSGWPANSDRHHGQSRQRSGRVRKCPRANIAATVVMSSEPDKKHEGHGAHLTLNRPRKANAFSASMAKALLEAVELTGVGRHGGESQCACCGTRRLAYRIGADAAREILSASCTFDADEALG